jgi:hypothetical protein
MATQDLLNDPAIFAMNKPRYARIVAAWAIFGKFGRDGHTRMAMRGVQL